MPPPYLEWPGALTAGKCAAMWRDPASLFRKMWARRPWLLRGPEDPHRADCWHSDERGKPQTAQAFFSKVAAGSHCAINWYRDRGQILSPPRYVNNAPALFGFDESIEAYCENAEKTNAQFGMHGHPHAWTCIQANVNILALYDG